MDAKNICLVAAEAVPFVKVGGMADVVGSLYKYLKGGNNIFLFVPLYKQIKDRYKTEETAALNVSFSDGRVEQFLLAKSADFPGVYFIGSGYFDREHPYGSGGSDYQDNALRFSLFAKAVPEAAKHLNIDVDIFHCHDWHTALLPLYLETDYRTCFPGAKTLFTIHNLGYQGVFNADQFQALGLPRQYFSMDELEFYGNVNFMKAGIIHSDRINTVSPTYAKEILTPEYGNNLDGLLAKHANKLTGIINGIDYQLWDPSVDSVIGKKYSNYKGKIKNKAVLQQNLNLPRENNIPVFGMVARLAEQKGLDELADIMETVLSRPVQIVILGDGEQKYKDILAGWQKKLPQKISVTFGFDEELAHRIYAGSDFFLMPSKFEPCGLGQLISFRYGTVPIARNVGGLSDTVRNYNFETGEGTGFTFEGGSKELLNSMESALTLFEDKQKMGNIVNSVINLDFSWKSSVDEYMNTYKKLAES